MPSVSRFIYALLIGCGLLLPRQTWAQQQAIKDLQRHHPASSVYFFYPSTLRMLNVDRNPDYYRLIRDVNLVVAVALEGPSPALRRAAVEKTKKAIDQAAYQNLFGFRQVDNQGSLFLREADGQPAEMFGFLETKEQYLVAYVDGYLDGPALLSLLKGGFDFASLRKYAQPSPKEQRKTKKKL